MATSGHVEADIVAAGEPAVRRQFDESNVRV